MNNFAGVESGWASGSKNFGRGWWQSIVGVACWVAAVATMRFDPATAADLYYDVIPTTADIDGGTDNWATANWKTTAAGVAGSNWAANDSAIFEPIVGSPATTTLTLGGAETATAVSFNGAGYTLTGGTLALAGNDGTNWINVNANAAIQSALTHMRFKGTGEVTISGGGTIATRGVVGDGGNNLVTVRQTGGAFNVNDYFMIGGNNVAASQGAYIMESGSLTIAQGIYLGWNGAGSIGTFTQNGGTVNTQSGQGIQIGIGGGTGAYTLNGGTLISGFGEFGSPYGGSFTFGGGTLQTNMSFNTNRQSGVATSIAAGATARINTAGGTVTTWSTTLTGPSANGLVKNGGGTLSLNGNFTGDVSVTGGLLQALSATSLGSGTISATGLTSDSGAVDLNGFSFSNPIVIGNRSAGPGAAGALKNTNTSSMSVLDGAVSIGGENYVGGDGSITFNGVVSGGLSNNYSLYKQGAGTWTFANPANTFDGFYYLTGGTTEVTKLANLNEPSSLGQPTTADANRVFFGFNGSGGGAIRFSGSAASSSDRVFYLRGLTAANSNRIDADGTSAAATLTLAGSLSTFASGSYTAALGGGNAGVNTYSGAISNGSGTVSLLKDGTTTWALGGTNTYSGSTTVSAGTLLINGNNGGAAGPVSVAAGSTLGGGGTVGGATTISGTHSPGTSPGLQTFANGLEYDSTSTLVWELSANTDLSPDRGTLYDGINLTTSGSLVIDPAATMSLVLNQPLADSTASTVDWTDVFWSSDRQWVIADVSSPVTWDGTTFGTLNVGADSLGASLTTVRPNASFSLAEFGGNLLLNYSAVPEPAAWLLTVSAAAGMLVLRCRRRTRNTC